MDKQLATELVEKMVEIISRNTGQQVRNAGLYHITPKTQEEMTNFLVSALTPVDGPPN